MPIFVRDFDWRQTNDTICVTIPLSKCRACNCNVFTSAQYIKVHHELSICELFLLHPVKPAASTCNITTEGVELVLQKVEPQLWPILEENTLSKEQKMTVRQQAVEQSHQEAQEHKKQLADQREKQDKLAIQEQVRLNEAERTLIEKNKEMVIHRAFNEVIAWKNQQEATKPSKPAPAVRRFPPPRPKVCKPVVKTPDVPPPRIPGEIEVQFTAREFPTPRRESMDPEEQEWLGKQAEARKAAGFCAQDLRPEELDPEWIKDKGDSFLRAGNFRGAEAAYSHAISLGCKLPALFCNRAAAHLALGNLHKAVEDSSEGLRLLTPETALNATSRARCHARRAAALTRLGNAKLAALDLQAALKLRPDDLQLQQDLRTVEQLV